MARGDLIIFNEAMISIGEALVNLETDTFKFGIIDVTVTPLQDTATPTWDGTSTQEFDGNEVTTSAEYPVGGLTISGPVWARTTNVGKWDDDGSNLSIAQNGSGFADAYWGIIYSDTSAAKNAICFIEFTGPVSQQAGPININFHTNGIFTMTN